MPRAKSECYCDNITKQIASSDAPLRHFHFVMAGSSTTTAACPHELYAGFAADAEPHAARTPSKPVRVRVPLQSLSCIST